MAEKPKQQESELAKKYEQASKFSSEEMDEIKGIQENYINVQNGLGQLSVAKLRLEEQLRAMSEAEMKLKEQFTTAQKKERDLVDKLSGKYGSGTLDPESGKFTPNPKENS